MPPPYTHSAYDEIVKDVLPGYVASMNDPMLRAAFNVKLTTNVQTMETMGALRIFNCLIEKNTLRYIHYMGCL